MPRTYFARPCSSTDDVPHITKGRDGKIYDATPPQITHVAYFPHDVATAITVYLLTSLSLCV